MRKATLGTLFLTVFLDLLGFGLVVPFLPGVARDLGASALGATLIGATFSFAQFFFIPLWGRLSDRIGRRPVLLWSIAASAVGNLMLAFSDSVAWLFVARFWCGVATANIAVAQAYIADITRPEERARGMGMIGMAFGLGFIFGPFVGGELSRIPLLDHEGALAALVAAGLSAINLAMASVTLPESLPPEQRARAGGDAAESGVASGRRRLVDLEAFRQVAAFPGLKLAIAMSFLAIFWFSGMEMTFRMFTEDAFAMTVAGTGRIFALVGVIAVIMQGALIHPLTRRFGEVRLLIAGALFYAAGFALVGVSPTVGRLAMLFVGAGVIAIGSGMFTPSLGSYTSRQAGAGVQGLTLGVSQSASALARVAGPIAGGLLYEFVGMRGPYLAGAVGLLGLALLASRLPALVGDREARAPAGAAAEPAAPTTARP